jgi:hypothetical protein
VLVQAVDRMLSQMFGHPCLSLVSMGIYFSLPSICG